MDPVIIDLTWRRRILAVVFPALLGPLQLLLFGPHTIFTGNRSEFNASFWDVAVHLLAPLLIVAVVLIGLGVLLPRSAFRAYVVTLFGFGLVIWAQGNLLVGDYGLLDGRTIDWNTQAWRSPYEMALWAGVPILAIAAAKPLFSVATFASPLLIALQTLVLMWAAVQAAPASPAQRLGVPESMFELSSRQNVFHIVLDGFQSDVFREIVEADRPSFDRVLSGFVFFADHAGAFPTTIASIPAMLTGDAYRNRQPGPQYLAGQFERGSIYGALRSQGYQVDVISELPFGKESASSYYQLPRPYVSVDRYTRFVAWQLADLAVFRHAPHVLKPSIYNDQQWRLQTSLGAGYADDALTRRHFPVNGQAFFEEFTSRMTVTREEPVYKFLHLGIPHWPVTLNAECGFIGVTRVTRETYAGQARCALARVSRFLDRLRELGVYDDSLILLSSDHGVALPPRGFTGDRATPGGDLSAVAGSALALLVVKPPHRVQPLQISSAPTTITDIPVTVLDLLGLQHAGLSGTPALKLDEAAERPRTFAVYPWDNEGWERDQEYFPYLDVFTIDGPVLAGNGWALAETIYAPGGEPERSRGLFGPERNSQGQAYRWTGPRAFLHAPSDSRGFQIAIRSVAPMPQAVTLHIDGKAVDRLTLDDQTWITVRHPLPEPTAGSPVWVELRVDPPWRPKGDSRLLGVMTRDLQWTR